MRILSIQRVVSVEHRVTIDGNEFPEFVRMGPGNWWRQYGCSLEEVGNSDELERLFLLAEKENPRE